jgi:hypothetical protein
MRLRAVLTLVAATAEVAAAATPSSAFIAPVCNTRVAAADNGVSAACSTDNVPQVGGMSVRRVIVLNVLTGAASATVKCGLNAPQTIALTGVGGTTTTSEDYSGSCTATVTAGANLTTATVSSTFYYVPIIYDGS